MTEWTKETQMKKSNPAFCAHMREIDDLNKDLKDQEKSK